MTNAEIAAAFEELGILYELDGAVRYRSLAYATAAKAIRESPRRPRYGYPGRRQDAAGEDHQPARDRDDSLGGAAQGEVPRHTDRGHAGAAPRLQDGAPA